MKLANIAVNDAPRLAAVRADDLIDLTAGMGITTVADLLDRGAAGLQTARDLLQQATGGIPFADVQFLAPLGRRGKILGVGMNYHDFVAIAQHRGMTPPPHRYWFYRPNSCVCGPRDEIWISPGATGVDYEAELVVVIGKRCRSLSIEQAPAVIAGYTIGNDITLREESLRSIVFAKSFDRQLPLGPWLVTADEIDNPHDLAIKTWVNGALRQDGNTASMIADCFVLIAQLSQYCTLEPGDIILTGTPAGCGILQTPPTELAAGDVVRIAIEKIGTIENIVAIEPS